MDYIAGRAEILLDRRVAADVVILKNVRTPEKYALWRQVNRVLRFVGAAGADFVSEKSNKGFNPFFGCNIVPAHHRFRVYNFPNFVCLPALECLDPGMK